MLQYVEQCIIAFIPIILPLIGMRLIFDYTRIILFRD